MASSSKSSTNHHIRCISLPTRSHPTTLKTEEELNKLKTWEASAATPTAETICKGLSGLEELYKCTDELLNLPVTRQVLCHHQHEKWVDELLDGSVRLLDICGNTRDTMSQTKEHIGNLQSCLRRRKGDLGIESSITKFICFRKKMKKDAKRFIASLKKMDNEFGGLQIMDHDHHLLAVIRVLREVSAMSISIFQSLLLFLSVPVSRPNPTKWSLVSKLMSKGTAACEGQLENANELENVDAALCSLCKSGSSETENMQIARNRLEAMEARIEETEAGLERIFRRLIRTRTSLLNLVSH